MAIKIHFDTENAAFSQYGGNEAARILREIADRIDTSGSVHDYITLRDINGNTVGEAEVHIGGEE